MATEPERGILGLGGLLLVMIGAAAAIATPPVPTQTYLGGCLTGAQLSQLGLTPAKLARGLGYTFVVRPDTPLLATRDDDARPVASLAALERAVILADADGGRRVLVSLREDRCGWVASAALLLQAGASKWSHWSGPMPLPAPADGRPVGRADYRVIVPGRAPGTAGVPAYFTSDLRGPVRLSITSESARVFHVFRRETLPDGGTALLLGVRTDEVALAGWVDQRFAVDWPAGLLAREMPLSVDARARRPTRPAKDEPGQPRIDGSQPPPYFVLDKTISADASAFLSPRPRSVFVEVLATRAGASIGSAAAIPVAGPPGKGVPPEPGASSVARSGERASIASINAEARRQLELEVALEPQRLRLATTLLSTACESIGERGGLEYLMRTAADLFLVDFSSVTAPEDFLAGYLHLPRRLLGNLPADWKEAEQRLRDLDRKELEQLKARICHAADVLRLAGNQRSTATAGAAGSVAPVDDKAVRIPWRLDDGAGVPLHFVPLSLLLPKPAAEK